MDGLELAQVLPGPNILNLAIYCGQKARGLPGAVAAFLGASIPPFAIILVAGALYFKFASNPFVHGALRGCAVGALGLTIGNALELSWDERSDWTRLVLLAVTAVGRGALPHAAAARIGRLRRYRRRSRVRPLAPRRRLPNDFGLLQHRAAFAVDVLAALRLGIRRRQGHHSADASRRDCLRVGNQRSVQPVLHDRKARAGADDHLRGVDRVCGDAGQSVLRCGHRHRRHVRSLERHHGRRRQTVGAFLRVAVAADHCAWIGACNRRSGVG